MPKPNLLRAFDVRIGTDAGRNSHRVLALSAMAAYEWALRQHSHQRPLRSLVIKPANL